MDADDQTVCRLLALTSAIAVATARAAIVPPSVATAARFGRVCSLDVGVAVVGRLRSVAEAVVVARAVAAAIITADASAAGRVLLQTLTKVKRRLDKDSR